MNLLLFTPGELDPDGVLRLDAGDRRAVHVREILRRGPGDRVRAARLGGSAGWGRLLESADGRLALVLEEEEPAPPHVPPRRVVVLALPRPPALRRILQLLAQLDVERLVLTGAARVEKSYFQSPLLLAGEWRQQLLLGMEQAMATRMPEVYAVPRLHEFLRDDLERWTPPGARRLVAHPGAWSGVEELPPRRGDTWCLALGPEGGWQDGELEAWRAHGFTPLSLGARVLKSEAALERVVAQLDLLEALAGRKGRP